MVLNLLPHMAQTASIGKRFELKPNWNSIYGVRSRHPVRISESVCETVVGCKRSTILPGGRGPMPAPFLMFHRVLCLVTPWRTVIIFSEKAASNRAGELRVYLARAPGPIGDDK